MGGKSSAPQSPDPHVTADEQIRVNQATIDQMGQANRTNQVTPTGSQSWTKDPATGQWTQTTSLDPRINDQLQQQITNTDLRLGAGGNALQQILNQGTAGTAVDTSKLPAGWSGDDLQRGNLTTDIDPSGIPGLPTQARGGDAASLKQAQDATYGQMTSRLDPQYKQAQNDLETQLVNEGVTRGSDAWDKAMGQFGRTRTDAYQTASNAAIDKGNALEGQLFGESAQNVGLGQSANNQAFQQLLARAGFGNAAKGQQFGESLQQGQFGNQARQQALSEMLAARRAPIDEANALNSGAQTMAPSFGQTGDINSSGAPNMGNLYGQQYQGQLNAYNSQVGQQNSTMGTVGSIAAAALMAF